MQAFNYPYTSTHACAYTPIENSSLTSSHLDDAATIKEHLALQGQDMALETIQKIVTLISTVQVRAAIFISRKQNAFFSHSVTIEKSHSINQVFISLHKKLSRGRGSEGFSYGESVRLLFDSEGRYLRSFGCSKVLKMTCPFDETNLELFKRIVRRISIMQDLAECPLFPTNYAFIEKAATQGKKLIIYQELASCDLMDYHLSIKKIWALSLSKKLTIAQELINGLSFLHQKGYVHKDFKPDNILVFMNLDGEIRQVKISDFGFACKASDTLSLMTRCGTLAWIAPEMVQSLFTPSFAPQFSPKLDNWALGLVLYNLSSSVPMPLQECLLQLNDAQLNAATVAKFQAPFARVLKELPSFPLTIDSLERLSSALVQKEPANRLSLVLANASILALQGKGSYPEIRAPEPESNGCVIS